ncbi:MAG: glycosyltransferase family 4 protein, partial [Nonlabens sp.]|nr:glycosyltransferase family 4 protein [Nonlabens sp.]
MIRVLHVNGEMGWGGNEQQLVDSILSFPVNEVKNVVYCAENGALSRRLSTIDGVQLIYSKVAKFKKNKSHFRGVVSSIKPDVIHIHTGSALTLFYMAYLFTAVEARVVFSKKGMGSSMSFLSKLKYNFKRIDVIICVSDFIKNAMATQIMFRKNLNKLVVVSDGVKEERIPVNKGDSFLEKNTKTVQLLNIANHTLSKDLEVLVDAINYLVRDLGFTDFYLHQVGAQSRLTESIKNRIDNYNLTEYIKMYDFVEDASSALHHVDMLIMTSKKEGGPSCIIEAMSQKVAVVTTDVGIVPQAIVSNQNGIVAPVKDFRGIANGIMQLSKDPDLREVFANRSYEIYANNFTAAITAQKTLDVYR